MKKPPITHLIIDTSTQSQARPSGHSAIHDLLYLDMKNGREFYNPEKNWDPDVLDRVAEIVAEFIPRPPRSSRSAAKGSSRGGSHTEP